MTDFNTYEFSKKENVLFYICLIALGLMISILFYHSCFLALIILPFKSKIRELATNKIIAKRKRDYMTQLKDFLFVASTSIGAGRSMKDATKEAIPEIRDIYGKDSILATELSKAYQRMQIGGENDVDVLMDLAINSGLEDCIDFVSIYSICKISGASLVVALNLAASVIIDKITIEKEIRELIHRKEMEGLIIFIMPLAVILFLNLCASDYITPMYDSIAGRIIMTGVIAASVGIYLMIKKIVNVEI